MPSVSPRKRTEDQKTNAFHVVATRFSIAQLNEVFARQLGRVIVDQTGLTGDFDFTIDLTPDESRPNPLDPSLILRRDARATWIDGEIAKSAGGHVGDR